MEELQIEDQEGFRAFMVELWPGGPSILKVTGTRWTGYDFGPLSDEAKTGYMCIFIGGVRYCNMVLCFWPVLRKLYVRYIVTGCLFHACIFSCRAAYDRIRF